eukprot:scaffold375_cov299-Chaetoceros_neogracile.AAC.9
MPSDKGDGNFIVLSKPIMSPEFKVGKRIQALTIAPVEWFASVIKLDLPARRPQAIYQEHKARSMIHVRIKLNASICGDVPSCDGVFGHFMHFTLFDEQEYFAQAPFCILTARFMLGLSRGDAKKVMRRQQLLDRKFYEATNLKATIVARCNVGTETYFSTFHEGL